MELYLKSTGIISGAGNSNDVSFLDAVADSLSNKLLCKEPDYSSYIQPMQLRRMSKAVRIGIAASKMCMTAAGIEKPDAISIGTAMGCLADTEFFLTKMTEQDEQMLTPTAFIQSTHNTVSGQIALLAGCYGHNLTFVQRGHSFEHAMINAQLHLTDSPDKYILVGGIDELTENSYTAFNIGGVYNDTNIAGEGVAFFIATINPSAERNICIKDIFCFTSDNPQDSLSQIRDFNVKHNLGQNIDLLISGRDIQTAELYNEIHQTYYPNADEVTFKHLCGEYPTASSFALGALVYTIQNNAAPQALEINKKLEDIKRVVIVNHFKSYYACWLIEID